MVAVGAIGIIIGVVNETGVGIRFAQLLSVGDSSLFLAFVFAMLGSLVLGMGLPTLPAYLIIVLVLGPAIVQLGKDAGVTLLAVHLFVFYFAALSSLTPPVALAAYAAAPIAGARPFETAVQSVRISLVSFVIPFVFVFNPSLLLIDKFRFRRVCLGGDAPAAGDLADRHRLCRFRHNRPAGCTVPGAAPRRRLRHALSPVRPRSCRFRLGRAVVYCRLDYPPADTGRSPARLSQRAESTGERARESGEIG